MTLTTYIAPGRLRHRLVLEQRTQMPDASGGVVESWMQIASVWAAIEPLAARVDESARQLRQRVTHRIVMRYRNDMGRNMRLLRDTRIFSVLTVKDPDESRRYQICLVEEVSP